jgi:hypothetical protein
MASYSTTGDVLSWKNLLAVTLLGFLCAASVAISTRIANLMTANSVLRAGQQNNSINNPAVRDNKQDFMERGDEEAISAYGSTLNKSSSAKRLVDQEGVLSESTRLLP